ncbi:MAG: hypothetical protein NFCOHLIN_02676 [Gammaproteobacteria bacterium]|nr:hypothetical protein [Gammaproteobacteria bacterium]
MVQEAERGLGAAYLVVFKEDAGEAPGPQLPSAGIVRRHR